MRWILGLKFLQALLTHAAILSGANTFLCRCNQTPLTTAASSRCRHCARRPRVDSRLQTQSRAHTSTHDTRRWHPLPKPPLRGTERGVGRLNARDTSRRPGGGGRAGLRSAGAYSRRRPSRSCARRCYIPLLHSRALHIFRSTHLAPLCHRRSGCACAVAEGQGRTAHSSGAEHVPRALRPTPYLQLWSSPFEFRFWRGFLKKKCFSDSSQTAQRSPKRVN